MGSMLYPILILTGFLIVYLILKFVFKINIFAFLNGGIMDLFKIAGIVGAIIEVLSLSDLAMNRGVPAITAYGRYSMLALVETLLGFWFISAMTESFYEKLKDGYVTVYEVIKTLLGVSWIFYLSYFITGNIWITYLESLGRVELQQAYVSLANSIRGIHIETNSENFDFDKGSAVTIEYGAWFTIYVSVLFNFLAMPYLLRKHWKEFRLVDPNGTLGQKLYSIKWLYEGTDVYISPTEIAKRKKEAEDKLKKAGKAATNPSTPAKTASKYFTERDSKGEALMDYLPFLKTMFDIDADEFKNYAFQHCGRNFETNTPISTSLTNPKVTDNSLTPDQALSKLTEDLVNKSSYGLKELYNKSKDLSEEMETVIKMKDSLIKLEEEIDKTTDTATRTTRTNDWLTDHAKYKSFVSKVEGLYNKYKGASSPFINALKTKNYPGNYNASKNVFEADYNLLKAYVQNIRS
jgi:hypothetical protein